ncbi:MAG: UvrD-helicase domain-containing protein [Bacteroidota bacterium]
MQLTSEQLNIVASEGDIKINAVAGSGKTSTLIAYAKQRQKERILYLAFNKSVRIEAVKKFAEQGLNTVRIETAHSLAYDFIVRKNNYKVKKEGVYKTTEIAEILGLNNEGNQRHTEYILANHINKFISYFCNSDKAKVQDLNYEDIVVDQEAKRFVQNFMPQILAQTRILLGKMDKGEIEITHDFYLKKFQQETPSLPYDYILFDEGQDASEAMLDVFLRQKAIKIIVGDTHQQIYAWRYAINSLEKVDFPTFHLTSSFRFSNEIAALATRILRWKHHIGSKENVRINGYGECNSTKTKAVLARTNMGLLIKAIDLLIEKKEIRTLYFEGRFERYTYADEGANIYDVLNLFLDKRNLIKDKLIASMNDINDLQEYIEKTEDAQLGMIVEVVKKYAEKLPDYIRTIKNNHIKTDEKHSADVVFSTVHKSKGMEYDVVTIVDDFITEKKITTLIEKYSKENLNIKQINEEINLLYVAVTRTRNTLNIPANLLPSSQINVVAPSESIPFLKDL